MKIYVTKFALTRGIFSIEGQICDDRDVMEDVSSPARATIYLKPDWHETREEAVAQAEVMRKRKIASVKKQLDKLEAMTFE